MVDPDEERAGSVEQVSREDIVSLRRSERVHRPPLRYQDYTV